MPYSERKMKNQKLKDPYDTYPTTLLLAILRSIQPSQIFKTTKIKGLHISRTCIGKVSKCVQYVSIADTRSKCKYV